MRNVICLIAASGLALAEGAAAAEPLEIPIWPGAAPGSEDSRLVEEYADREVTDGTGIERDRHVSGVTRPALTVYLPEKAKSTGVAVVICPGGAFRILAIDKEGHDVARWLAAEGIAGVVVKYRLPDPDQGVFVSNGCIPDVQRAMRLTRHHAGEWNIDPGKIGVMGFSAGGYLAAAAGTLFDAGDPDAPDPVRRAACRPDFIAPIYPLVSLDYEKETGKREDLLGRMLGENPAGEEVAEYSLESRVTALTPPAFLVHAYDDGLSIEHSLRFVDALRGAKIRAELHLYSRGGHGFGMRQRGEPISLWRERWLEWMRAEGFLDAATR